MNTPVVRTLATLYPSLINSMAMDRCDMSLIVPYAMWRELEGSEVGYEVITISGSSGDPKGLTR